MHKNKKGEMSFYTIIFVLILLVILIPAFAYMHVRQANTEAIASIDNSLRNKTESNFVQLYDEIKTSNKEDYVFAAMVNDDIFNEKFIESVIYTAGFELYSAEEDGSEYFKNKAGIELFEPFLSVDKTNTGYEFKLVYKLKQSFSVLGLNLLNTENDYISLCKIEKNTLDKNQFNNDVKNNFGISNYIYKVKLGENIYAYLVDDGGITEKKPRLIITGTGTKIDDDVLLRVNKLEFKDGSTVEEAGLPWNWDAGMPICTYFDSQRSRTYHVGQFYMIDWQLDCEKIPDKFFKNYNHYDGFNIFKLSAKVNEIGYEAFYNCTSLKTVNLNEECSVIGTEAFRNCSNLEELILPDNLQNINSGAFFGCHKLDKLELPASVLKIKRDAFTDCKLSVVSYLNFKENFNKIISNKETESPFRVSDEYVNEFEVNRNISIIFLNDTIHISRNNY